MKKASPVHAPIHIAGQQRANRAADLGPQMTQDDRRWWREQLELQKADYEKSKTSK